MPQLFEKKKTKVNDCSDFQKNLEYSTYIYVVMLIVLISSNDLAQCLKFTPNRILLRLKLTYKDDSAVSLCVLKCCKCMYGWDIEMPVTKFVYVDCFHVNKSFNLV